MIQSQSLAYETHFKGPLKWIKIPPVLPLCFEHKARRSNCYFILSRLLWPCFSLSFTLTSILVNTYKPNYILSELAGPIKMLRRDKSYIEVTQFTNIFLGCEQPHKPLTFVVSLFLNCLLESHHLIIIHNLWATSC